MSEGVRAAIAGLGRWGMIAASAGMAAVATAAYAAQARVDGAGAASSVTSTARFAAVVGVAWRADNEPIPGARVRLRDIAAGRVTAHALATEAGRFTFKEVLPGSYAVELVSQAGHVLTVGSGFTVAGGETVATFVRLGSRSPWFDGFFANAAAAVASAAAAAGVTAVAPEVIRPASPTR